MVVLMAEIDIMLMYVETLKTDVIVFIAMSMCLDGCHIDQ
jgi:hypothetical protein